MWVSLARKKKMMHEKNNVTHKRKEDVEGMFDSIAPRYDFLNHFLSLGTDRLWRRRAVNMIARHIKPSTILDVATGTADLAIEAMRLQPLKITGIDISTRMLEAGRNKLKQKGLADRIELLSGDSQEIAFPDGTFNVVMSAFGVRNFSNTLAGLKEMFRVLSPGGMVMILEFSKPSWFPFRQIYSLYFTRLLPWMGRRISGDRKAYSYLPESVMSFPENEAFTGLMHEAGFTDCGIKRLSGGIASIYYGFKR